MGFPGLNTSSCLGHLGLPGAGRGQGLRMASLEEGEPEAASLGFFEK